jgi:hypothetical protein
MSEESWEKAFTIEKERMKEFVDMYESMGYEVKIEETEGCGMDDGGNCSVCYLSGDYVTIYIRRKDLSGEDEDLFD